MLPGETNDLITAFLLVMPSCQALRCPFPDTTEDQEVFWDCLPKWETLRELWVTAGSRDGPDADRAVALAAELVSRCPWLLYVRVSDWAWKVQPSTNEGEQPTLTAQKNVEGTLPLAFHFGLGNS
jgi:hypothetical protein